MFLPDYSDGLPRQGGNHAVHRPRCDQPAVSAGGISVL